LLDEPIGAALDRDITSSVAPGENVEAELDAFISRRDRQRLKEEGERQEEELWRETVRRHKAQRDAQLREEWANYHQGQAERLRANLEALIAHHEAKARQIGTTPSPRSDTSG